MYLNAKSFGLACGLLWGIILFIFTLVAVYTGYGKPFLDLIDSVYPGYSIGIGGSFGGLVLGFVDGFVGGWIFAGLYNWLSGKMK